MGLFILKDANELLTQCGIAPQPLLNPLVFIEHDKHLVGLVDRRRCVVLAIAIECLVKNGNLGCPAIGLEPKAVVLEACAGALVEFDVVLLEPGALVDARPVFHANVKQVDIVLRIERLVVVGALVADRFFFEMVYTVIVCGEAVVVGANKVQVVLNGSVVELLKHIRLKVVIGL